MKFDATFVLRVTICVTLAASPTCLRAQALNRTAGSAVAEKSTTAVGNTIQYVPRNLLGLIHAPEVHRELELSTQQVQQLESLFREIDGDWFRSRIRKPEEQYKTLVGLEQRVWSWFAEHASSQQLQRLKQLELQSQGIRMLHRPDLVGKLALSAGQRSDLVALAEASNAAAKALQQAVLKNEVTDQLTSAVGSTSQAEQQALKTVLTVEQLQKLSQIVGPPFETSQLKRIYPLAPELEPVEHWINSQPLTLQQLRGKVVVLHFYAFQCHNCHANFEHYNRWHDEFDEDDVVVIGIQTPETARERDPAAVRAAAQERDFKYPVLVDLESKNWASWGNTMWPTVYVIDKQGYIRQWWQGELNWQGATGDKTIHDLVTSLLAE